MVLTYLLKFLTPCVGRNVWTGANFHLAINKLLGLWGSFARHVFWASREPKLELSAARIMLQFGRVGGGIGICCWIDYSKKNNLPLCRRTTRVQTCLEAAKVGAEVTNVWLTSMRNRGKVWPSVFGGPKPRLEPTQEPTLTQQTLRTPFKSAARILTVYSGQNVCLVVAGTVANFRCARLRPLLPLASIPVLTSAEHVRRWMWALCNWSSYSWDLLNCQSVAGICVIVKKGFV
jgi:hypothetical protein